MPSTAQLNTFTNSFMRGFSFVDDINARRRRERTLEEELANRRAQQERQNRIQDEELAFLAEERGRAATDRERGASARSLLSDPNVPLEQLQEFSDIPEVSQAIRQRTLSNQEEADLGVLFGGQRLGGGAPQAAPAPAAVAAEPGAAVGDQPAFGGQPLPLPGDRFAKADPAQRLTTLDLQRMADEDPQAAQEAARLQQENEARDGDRQVSIGTGPMGEDEFRPAPNREEIDRERARAARNQLDADYELFLDVENREGDEIRGLPPATLTGQYFSDRNSVSDDVRSRMDRRMRAPITETITNQREILSDPDLPPQEQRAATLRLNRAVSLAQEIGVDYKPLKQTGVDARGLPNNNANPALTQSVLQNAAEQPGTPLPQNPQRQRADETIVNRGTSSRRISERFAQASYRLLKGGRITWDQYESLMTTGKLPSSAPEIKAFAPDQDIFSIDPRSGQMRLVRKGKPQLTAKEREAALKGRSGRNLVDEDGLDYVNNLAKGYDTEDDPNLGRKLVDGFLMTIQQNEQGLRDRGRDLSSVNDVAWAWSRYLDVMNFEGAYNDELFYNGRFTPEFSEDFGTVSQAFLDPRLDEAVASGEFEDPRTGETVRSVAPLPGQQTIGSSSVYNQIRQQFPQLANATDQEIEAELQRQAGR